MHLLVLACPAGHMSIQCDAKFQGCHWGGSLRHGKTILIRASQVQGIVEGKPVEGTPLICDVRDVANAHVLAAETPSASGRYIVSQGTPVTATYLSKVLRVSLRNPSAHPWPP